VPQLCWKVIKIASKSKNLSRGNFLSRIVASVSVVNPAMLILTLFEDLGKPVGA